MLKSNYEQQCFLVRCYRWWRYMPLAVIWSSLKVVFWVLTGMVKNPDATLKWEAKSIWRWSIANAEYNMGDYVSLKDAIKELREKYND